MKFSYNWLQSYFSKKLLDPNKLAQILTLGIFEVKGIEKKDNDYILELDITPNRPDCLSYFGIAKECKVLAGASLKIPSIKINAKESTKDVIKVENLAPKQCLRYCSRIVLDIKVGESPKWIQERLIVNGIQPINNIVDAVNYVMLETGQPLHAFDCQKIEGKKIIVRLAREDEKIAALDDNTYQLHSDILVIADSKKPLAIAGIKGGKGAGISNNTRNIFIESANFDSLSIRKSCKKLNLKTDASIRFEHGVDKELCSDALDRAAVLIAQIAQAKIAKEKTDIYPVKYKKRILRFNLESVKKITGLDISKNQIVSILKSLEIKILKSGKSVLGLEIPSFRSDLIEDVDIVEEVIRIYGLNRIKSNLPVYPITIPKRNETSYWEEQTKDILKELGFFETYNYSFISSKDSLGLNNLVELENPVSDEFKYLRPSLLINLLKLIESNLRIKQIQGKSIRDYLEFFEIGKTFNKAKEGLIEKRMLTGIVWAEKERNGFFCTKSIVETLLKRLGITNYYFDVSQNSSSDFWAKSKTAEIKIDGKAIGYFGELTLRILKKFDAPQWVFGFDIDFDALAKECNEENEFRPIPKFPAAVRDISILVPKSTRVAEVLNVIEKGNLKDADLFDIYEGKELPSGKKNLAFHLIFQSEDKTLSGAEIDAAYQNIIKEIQNHPEWEVRK